MSTLVLVVLATAFGWVLGFMWCTDRVLHRVFLPWRDRVLAQQDPDAFAEAYNAFGRAWNAFVRATMSPWNALQPLLLSDDTHAD